jgi:poly(A) polymerase
MAAIRRHAPQLVRISPERIAEELRTMLLSPTRVAAYRMLQELELRQLIFRFLELPTGPGRIDLCTSVFEALTPDRDTPFGLALAAASMDQYLWFGPANADARRLFERSMAAKVVRALRQALKLSNDESEDLRETLEGLDALVGFEPPTVAVLKRFLARPTASLSRELLDALLRTALLDKPRVQWLQHQLAALEKTTFAPPPFITGDDLTAAGMTPGPAFKRLLDAVYDAQLEDRVTTKPEALALVMQMAAQR